MTPNRSLWNVSLTAAAVMFVTVASTSRARASSLEKMDTFREALRRKHVAGLKEGPPSDERSRPSDDMSRALGFATGKKTEIYCRGEGLVGLETRHNDGSWARVVLVSSNREMRRRSYNMMAKGDWVYELSSTFRKPMQSQLWIVASTKNSYNIKENRNHPNGKSDTGSFQASWSDHRDDESFNSQGGDIPEGFAATPERTHEPLPWYMALDYHLWGNSDLGYRISFDTGFTDSRDLRIRSMTKDFTIRSSRRVGERLPTYETKDSGGAAVSYNDCYPVNYEIALVTVHDDQLQITGDIDVEAVRSAIKTQIKAVQACYDQALPTDSQINGRVTVAFEINNKGIPVNVREEGRSLVGKEPHDARDEMIRCTRETVSKWSFPEPKGMSAQVRYIFRFINDKRAVE
ncbi:MAG: AgmX/PglI C-terminal domain-containing protein [Bdellovibrionales bacterium]